MCEELNTPISTACPETSHAYPDNLEKVKPCSNKESLVFKSPQKALAGNVSKNKGNIQKSPQRQQSIETIQNKKPIESMPITIVKAPQNPLGENTSNIQKSPEQQQSIEAINNIKSVESMSISIEQAQLCSDNSSEIKDSSSIIKFPQKSHDENVSDNTRNVQKSPQRQQSLETTNSLAPMPINIENAQHSSDNSSGIGESSATHKSPEKVLGEHVIENNGNVQMPTHQQQSIENIKTTKSIESRPNQAEPESGNHDKCVVKSVDIPRGTKKSSDSLKSPKRKQRKISGTSDKSSLSDMGNLPNVENSTLMSPELKRTRKLPEQFLELLKKPKSNSACASTETSKASINKPKSNTTCSSTETSKASYTKSKLKETAPVFIKLQRPQKRQTRSLSMQQSSNEPASNSETNPISRSLVEVESPCPKDSAISSESSSEKQISSGSPPSSRSMQDLEVDKQLEATSVNKLVLNKTSERLDSLKHKKFSENLETSEKSAKIMAGHTEILKENASPTTSKQSGNDELRQRLDQAMKIYFQRYNKVSITSLLFRKVFI